MTDIRKITLAGDIGTTIKQGDTAEVHYSLHDAVNGTTTSILNQPAEVVFLQDGSVVYRTAGQVDDMYMCKFHIDQTLPAGTYHVEFIVNGGIYPSNDKPYFTITKSSRGGDVDIIKAYGFDDIVARVKQELANETVASEVISARGGKATLGERLDETTAQLAQKITKDRGAVTSADLSQEVKEQMTGGSVAVVGKNAILTENVVNGQITPTKTSFARGGGNENLWDGSYTSMYLSGVSPYQVTRWGNEGDNAKLLSVIISVQPNTEYTISKTDSDRLIWGEFESVPELDMIPISYENVTSQGNTTTLTTKSNGRYLLIQLTSLSGSGNLPNWFKIEQGRVSTLEKEMTEVSINLSTDSLKKGLDLIPLIPNQMSTDVKTPSSFAGTHLPGSYDKKLNVSVPSLKYVTADYNLESGKKYSAIIELDIATSNELFGSRVEIQDRTTSNVVNYNLEHLSDGIFVIKDFQTAENGLARLLFWNYTDNPVTIKKMLLAEGGYPSISEDLSSMYIAPDGNDNNSGDTFSSPLKTLQKAIDLGATTIYMAKGVYLSQSIVAEGIDELTIYGGVEGDEDPKERSRHKSKLINGRKLDDLTYSGGLYSGAVTLDQNDCWKEVFVDKSLPINISGAYVTNPKMETYNAVLWQIDESNDNNTIRLKPVLSMAELNSAEGSFYYDGATVTINPTADISSLVFYKGLDRKLDSPTFKNIGKLRVSDLEFSFHNGPTHIELVHDYKFTHCDFKFSTEGSNGRPFDSNGQFIRCEASFNQTDGFGPIGVGNSDFIDCESHHNGDDGVSHHNATTGSIRGGEYHHNPKGGVIPTQRAKVDAYNVIAHNNDIGFSWRDGLGQKVRSVGNVAYDNRIGLQISGYEVLNYGSNYDNNTTPKSISSSELTNYIELGNSKMS